MYNRRSSNDKLSTGSRGTAARLVYTRGDSAGQHASWSRHESNVGRPELVHVDRWTRRERSILVSAVAFNDNCRSSSSSLLDAVAQCTFRLKYVLALHICRIGIQPARAARYNDDSFFVQLNSVVHGDVYSHSSPEPAKGANFVLQKHPEFLRRR